jgi:hypothetical protein
VCDTSRQKQKKEQEGMKKKEYEEMEREIPIT